MKKNHPLLRLWATLAFALVVNINFPVLGQRAPKREPLPNYDKREERAQSPHKNPEGINRVAQEKKAAARLQSELPEAQIEINSANWARFLHARDGFLSGPNGNGKGISAAAARTVAPNDRHGVVKAFVNDHEEIFGFNAEALERARITREFVDANTGMRTVVWQQEVDGLPVFDQIFKSHTTKNGELVNVSSQFVSDPEKAANKGAQNRVKFRNKPALSAPQAVAKAAQSVGESTSANEVKPLGRNVRNYQAFNAAKLKGETHAQLIWFAVAEDELRLAWEVLLTSQSRGEMFRVLIDAQNGDLLLRHSLTAHASDASFRVYTSDSPSPFSPGHSTPSTVQPPLVSRVLVVTNAFSALASPNGWINDGDNETFGNNVDAHLDRNDDDQPDLPRPQGANRVFDFPLDLTQSPISYGDAATVQLFYWCNWMHDKLYELGFTEAAGNFQVDNFGRGGFANDALQADAQDGADLTDGFHSDNANMSTPPDGFPPRMQMYLWSGPTPNRDGDLDAEVILHEYAHGLSNRRVGGGVGLSALQSRGMGEGWSDFYGLCLLSESSDDINGVYASGAYVGYKLGGGTQNYYFGDRHYPYTTDMSKNPYTFKDIDPTQASPHAGIPRNTIYGPFDPADASEVHGQGEVWCTVLWDMRNNLVAKHGYETGNRLALQLVTDGMNLTPANPNFLQARDGILQADLVKTGGANLTEIWKAFAKRGMGASAIAPDSSTTTGVVEAYDLPGVMISDVQVIGGNGNGRIDYNECNELQLTLVNRGAVGATGISGRLFTTTPGVVVVQPVSAYPNLASGASAANAKLFKISTSPEFVCGTPVEFFLVLKSDQETRTNQFKVQSGTLGAPVRFDNNSAVTIPDNSPEGINSPIQVSGISTAIGKVVVSLHAKHTFDFDVVLKLTSPDGTTITLSQNNGGQGDNYGSDCSSANRTSFDDAGTNSIVAGSAPFVGTFRPEQPLSTFNGKLGAAVNGTWQLNVSDGLQGDTGSLQCWSLTLYPAQCSDGGGECPGVDLAVGMKSAPEPVMVGSNLVYTLSVTNFGPNTAREVVLNHSLPSGVQYSSATTSQGTVQQGGGIVTGSLGSMSAGQVATVRVTVIPISAGDISSTVSVSSRDVDFDLNNNSATVNSRVNPPAADLAINMAASPNPAFVGGTLTYTITVTNNGPSSANSVLVTNTLPVGVAVISASSSQGSCSNLNNGTILGSLGTIASANTATITIAVMPIVNGTLIASSRVAATQVDPVPGNNAALATTVVNPAADLVLSIIDSPKQVVLNSNLTYTITVSNRGPSIATGVTVSDTLSSRVDFTSGNASQGAFTRSGGLITWNVGTIEVGSNATLQIVTKAISKSDSVLNTGSVGANQADPNPANNTLTVQSAIKDPFVSVVAAGAFLTAETQTNGAIDFGETVTLDFYLQNKGNVATTNIVATLLTTGGVNSPSAAQNYGVLSVGDSAISRPFTFTAPANGSNVIATLQLQDGFVNLGTVSFVFQLPKQFVFTNATAISIPDAGIAALYPSQIVVSNLPGIVGNVTATLVNVNHTYPDDLDILLISSGGQKITLMSDAGEGNALSNVTLDFDDNAVSSLPDADLIFPGVYRPTDFPPADVFPNVPAGSIGTSLAECNGINPNGTWSLYAMDDSSGDLGNISGGWKLTITTITPVNPVADLAVNGTAAPNPVLLGNNLTYTFTVTNAGPSLRRGVVLTDVLPGNLSFISATSSQGNFVNSSGALEFTLGDIQTGSNAVVTIVATPKTSGAISNTVSVRGNFSEVDPFAGNNTATVVANVTAPVVDLVLLAYADPNPIFAGSNLTYYVAVTNKGPGTAYNTIFSGPNISSDLGTIPPGVQVAFSFSATPQNAGFLTNILSVSTVSADTNLANNSVELVVKVNPPAPVISITGMTLLNESLVPANGAIDAGETVALSVQLANSGAADTTNLSVTLLATNGVAIQSGPQIYGALTAGGSSVARTFVLIAAPNSSGTITATFQLKDGETDLGVVTKTFTLPNVASAANASANTIPEFGKANVYPASINISGASGIISKVTVTLSNLNHSFPDDLDILLVGPNGRKVMLMSDVGGGGALTNVTVTLDESASASLPDSGRIVSGSYKPTDYELGDVLPLPAPLGASDTLSSAFNGINPNGTWSLFVSDDTIGDSGALSGGWSIAITTVQTVNPAADIAIALSAPGGSIFVGDEITYTIQVVNNGPATATGVTVTNNLPAELTFVSATTPQGNVAANGSSVIYNLGNINSGASVSLTLTARATAAGSLAHFVSVQSPETDLNLANNSAQIVRSSVYHVHPLLSPATASAGEFKLTLKGEPGTNYVIQISADLVNWLPLSTNITALDGTLEFTDTDANSANTRFYRAVRKD